MKFYLSTLFLTAISGSVPVSSTPTEKRQTSTGNGPYAPAQYSTDSSLPNHTLFQPKSVPAGTKLPVLLWGNGGCSADALSSANFLLQIASSGVLVIASGTPKGSGSTTADLMTAAVDWVRNKAGTGTYANINASRIIAAGWSCGGIEAYTQVWNSGVESIGIWSSGLLTNYTMAGQIKKPVFYFLGGSSDIAYQNGERDYAALPAGTPKWKGNLPVGHGGTYTQDNGGKFGIAASYWVSWLLRGNTTASSYFTGAGATNDGWTVQMADLDKISVTPI